MINIVILGASGFVGNALSDYLYKKKKYKLYLFDRNQINEKEKKRNFFKTIDIRYLNNFNLPSNNFYVINLCAELGNKNLKENTDNNVTTTQRIIKILQNNSFCKGIVHFSSISALRKISAYGITKKKSEVLFNLSKLKFIILQSEMIIGKNARSITKLKKFLKLLPFYTFLPNRGKVIRYPIPVNDVCNIVEKIINKNYFTKKTYSIISKKIFLKDLVKKITKKKILNLNKNFLLMIARIFEYFFDKPIFTYDNAYGICSNTKLNNNFIRNISFK